MAREYNFSANREQSKTSLDSAEVQPKIEGRAFKDSGIEWIGQIPKEWKVMRMKFIGEFQNGLTYRPTDVCGSEGVLVLRSSNIQESKLDFNDNIYVNDCPSELMVNYGDIIICSRNGSADLVGKCAVVDKDIHASFGAFMVRFRSQISNKYAFYLVSTVIPQYKQFFTTTTINQLTKAMLSSMTGVLPPQVEQQKIADYLDKVCGEVDKMVALQETMIEELKVYKQSVITEVVTKGLNPNVPMRDSGIDWIGEIPEHWKLEPLKYCFGRRSEKNNPVKTEERLSLSIDKGVTLYSEKTTNLDRFKEDFTQYQLAYPNDIVLNCMNMIVGAVGLSNYMGCVSPVYYVIYPVRQDINPLYYSYLLNIPTIRGVYYSLGKGIYAIERGEGRVNTCRLKVAYNDFGRLDIPVPPLEEQREITEFVQQKCSEIDSLIALKQAKIEELKEYKKSVIYEYVTGKKEFA